jgi:hypothetical protein
LGGNQIPAEIIQAGDEPLFDTHKLIVIFGIWKNFLSCGRSPLLYKCKKKKGGDLTSVIIEACHHFQLQANGILHSLKVKPICTTN